MEHKLDITHYDEDTDLYYQGSCTCGWTSCLYYDCDLPVAAKDIRREFKEHL